MLADETALGIEALLELFLCGGSYATQKSDCRKPDRERFLLGFFSLAGVQRGVTPKLRFKK